MTALPLPSRQRASWQQRVLLGSDNRKLRPLSIFSPRPLILRTWSSLPARAAGVPLNACGGGVGCRAEPELRELRVCSALAMRMLGTAAAAAAAAVESRPLPRVPAALCWQWKQVVESGGATPHHGLSRDLAVCPEPGRKWHSYPPWHLLTDSSECELSTSALKSPSVSAQLLVINEQRLGALGGSAASDLRLSLLFLV